jgi:hypothetical protein
MDLWFYGFMGDMKTTIELPDDLLTEAKKRAAEERTTLRAIIEEGLRSRLDGSTEPRRKRRIKWVTVAGYAPNDLDDRAAMYEWLRSQ